MLLYNNTILSETQANGTSNTHWRNNLFLGQNSGPAIFSVNTYTNYTSSDYNGFRPNPGAATSFQWNSPPFTVVGRLFGAEGRGGGGFTGASAQRSRPRWHPPLGEGRGGCRLEVAAAEAGPPRGWNSASFHRLRPTARRPTRIAQRARRLRHLCECAETRRAGLQHGAASLQGGGFGFPTKT